MIRLVIVLLILASLACSLSASDEDPTVTPVTLSPVATITPALSPTAAVIVTATLQPTLSTGGNTGNPTTCVPRADWPVYVVVAGDTLGVLAQRTGTTVTALAAANCLNNTDLIAVGQQLRVPRQPNPVVIPPTTVAEIGPIQLSPVQNFDGLTYFVSPFTSLHISWPDAARLGATQVEFMFLPEGDPTVLSLGNDTDLSTDAAIQWTVPGNTRGELWAASRGANAFESPRVRLETVETVPGRIEPVTVSTYNDFDGNTYWVDGNSNVTLDWAGPAARTASSVEFFYYSPSNANGTSLGIDNTMLDGASISWRIPANANGQLTVRVRMPDGMTFESPRVGIVAQ